MKTSYVKLASVLMHNGLSKKFSRYRSIVFDLDGTLINLGVDWDGLKGELNQTFQRRYGMDVSFHPLSAGLKQLDGRLGPAGTQEAYSVIRRFEAVSVLSARLLPGRRELVSDLFIKGKRLSIFSSNLHITVDRALYRFALTPYFSVVVGGDDVTNHKPSLQGLNRIQEMLGLRSEDTAYVTDSPEMVERCKQGGIDTFLL